MYRPTFVPPTHNLILVKMKFSWLMHIVIQRDLYIYIYIHTHSGFIDWCKHKREGNRTYIFDIR